MNNYENSVAIIGAGISGLALGSFLKENNFPCVIFERSSNISEYGAGISISPNGKDVLKKLNILEELKTVSGNSKKTTFYSNLKEITSIDTDVITTSRKNLYDLLLKKYYSLGGVVLFDYELNDIDIKNKNIFFKNGVNYHVNHIAACDGIKSKCRQICFGSEMPQYSGYSVWRTILDQNQININFYLGSGFHIVSYPINNNKTSFVAAVKTREENEESWMLRGTYSDLSKDIPIDILDNFETLKDKKDIYKWGIYTRSKIESLYSTNVTLFGDAAHPITPFIGQGGCMALEDVYEFTKVLKSNNGQFLKTQKEYQSKRLKRVRYINKTSMNQGKLNHTKNPFLVFLRNFLMKNTNIIRFMTKKIWEYRI